ncbi:MAG: DUF6496 domain-containing protein [Acidobacteriaceae bacterium]|nr:DUF6496 domain-containing protein [Acidobacteriaceae bacterium]
MATKKAATKRAAKKSVTKKAAKKSTAKKATAKKTTTARKAAPKKAAKKTTARKYSTAASKNVETEMREFNRGTLKSGSGKKVTSRKQAIAIGLSEARKAGKKVPPAPRKK